MRWTEFPIWRIYWLERAFFRFMRWIDRPARAAFVDYLFGFDVSKWQAAIDFLKMWIYGAKFLILRCVYGITADERFEEYMTSAPNYFHALSVYAFYDPRYDPVTQARKVIAVLGKHGSKVRRVWLDLEFWWDGAYKAPQHWKTYRDTIKAAGYRVGWYTRATWWDSRVGIYASEFAKDPVWAAQYSTSLTLIPKGWTAAMIWQKGTPAIGITAGVSSAEIDYNLWNDEFDFRLEWDAPIPPEGGTTMFYRATGNINIRTSPEVADNATGQYVLTGDIVESDVAQSGFIHIVNIYRNNVLVTIPPVSWCGAYYLEPTVYTPPVPVVKVPFTFKADGFKLFSGDLEKE